MFIMIPQENIKLSPDFNEKVMSRIKVIFYAKKILHPIILEITILTGLTMVSMQYFSVKNVLANSITNSFSTDVSKVTKFWTSAFTTTDIPQEIIIAFFIVLSILAFQISKNIIFSAKKAGFWWNKSAFQH